MTKKKKKEAAARVTVLAVVAVCLILLSIFGIWLIGQLSDENTNDPQLGTDSTNGKDNDLIKLETPEEIRITVGKLLYEMQSKDIITLFYNDASIDISAADASGSYDPEKLKAYVADKGYDSSAVDEYISLGNGPESRPLDENYIRGAIYSLNDLIHKDMVQGYTVEDKKVTVYKADQTVNVDTEKTFESVSNAVRNGSFGRLEAAVIIDKSGEPNWQEISERVNVEPKNAEYVYNEETKRSELVPEESGYSLDIESVRAAYNASTESVLSFTVEEVKPEITVENIEEKMFPDKLTYYSTWYNVNEENRSNNLELATAAINGEVVLPGKQFSFNTVVGERTPERGYKKATIYTSDGMTDDYGGGICQVVSTLYCSLLYEDVKIVRRTEHGYTVSYVDLGKDATVSYGWIDFVFENNFEYPIMVKAYTSGGYLYVDIMGTKVDQIDVTIRHETVEEFEPEIEIEKDETLEPEEYKLISKGKKGYVIKTYMAVTKNGEYLGERLLHTSTYDALNGKAHVGVNWTESTEPAETTASSSETTSSSSETSSSETSQTPPETSSETTEETSDTSESLEPAA